MKGWMDEGMGGWRDGWIFKRKEEYVKISIIQRIRDKKSACFFISACFDYILESNEQA